MAPYFIFETGSLAKSGAHERLNDYQASRTLLSVSLPFILGSQTFIANPSLSVAVLGIHTQAFTLVPKLWS